MTDGIKTMTQEGTPQGGVISPLLCNIALNGLENAIKNHPEIKGIKLSKIKIIRYADDIVITGTSKEILQVCQKALAEFIAIRGLTLSEEKTRITHIEDGIDLLGFNIRRKKWNFKWNAESKQDKVLVITPTEKSVKRIQQKIKQVI